MEYNIIVCIDRGGKWGTIIIQDVNQRFHLYVMDIKVQSIKRKTSYGMVKKNKGLKNI